MGVEHGDRYQVPESQIPQVHRNSVVRHKIMLVSARAGSSFSVQLLVAMISFMPYRSVVLTTSAMSVLTSLQSCHKGLLGIDIRPNLPYDSDRMAKNLITEREEGKKVPRERVSRSSGTHIQALNPYAGGLWCAEFL